MSLTSKQIDELRAYAKDRKGEIAKLVSDAADTIELLSAKLSAANMERSSQYYHDGWIPCDERMPEHRQRIIAFYPDEDGRHNMQIVSYNEHGTTSMTAWMPLPEPYKEVEQNG